MSKTTGVILQALIAFLFIGLFLKESVEKEKAQEQYNHLVESSKEARLRDSTVTSIVIGVTVNRMKLGTMNLYWRDNSQLFQDPMDSLAVNVKNDMKQLLVNIRKVD